MLIIFIAAVLLHGYVVFVGASFYLTDLRGREDDCHVVALLTTTSTLFLVMQLVQWLMHITPHPSNTLWVGFAACNGAVYVGIIRRYTHFRARRHDERRLPAVRRV